MPPITLQDGTQLDPKVVKVMRAIRTAETGPSGDYENRSGDNGSSAGAFQWNNDNKPLAPGELPSHWKSAAAKVLGEPNAPMTRENQNKVAYQQILDYKNQGLQPDEIDALWNGAHKDAATGKYVHNNPKRATQFQQALNEQIGQTNQDGTYNPTPFSNPTGSTGAGAFDYSSSSAPPTQSPGFFQGLQQDVAGTNPEPVGTQLMNTAKGAANFLFPIAGDLYHDAKGDSSKTGLQQFGDAALSALPFIPGLGEAGEAARGAQVAGKGVGLIGKLAGSSIAKNAVLGYGAGTASNLSQGQSIGQALIPQASNVGGAFLGGGTAGVLNRLAGPSEVGAVDKMEQAYTDAMGATKTGVRASSKVSARGVDSPAAFLAKAGIPPETAEVNGRRIFTTGEDSQTYQKIQERVSNLTDLRDGLIDTTPTDSKSSLDALRNEALKKAESTFYGTERGQVEDHINKEFDLFEQQFGGKDVPLKDLNTIKKHFQSNSNYDTTRPSTITQANKMIAATAREMVEKDAEKAGIPGIKDLNALIRQHLDFLNTDGKPGILSKLNGQPVKGGRLGVHVKEMVGAGAGAAAAGALGGGPIGEFAGTIAGGVGGNMVSKLLQHFAVGGPGFASRIEKMAQEDPQLVQMLSELLAKRGGTAPQGLIAPNVVPVAKKASGIIPSLITKGAARVGAAL